MKNNGVNARAGWQGAFSRLLRRFRGRLLLLLFAPLTYVLMFFAASHPLLVETVYSRHIYPVVSLVLSRLTAFTPWCMAELLIIAAVLVLPCVVVVRAVRHRVTLHGVASAVMTVLAGAAVGYFLLEALWGLNYNRLPLAQNLGYRPGSPTVRELSGAMQSERDAVNTLIARGEVSFAHDEHSLAPQGLFGMGRLAMDGYNRLAESNRLFSRGSIRPKPVLLSLPWSYTGTEGIFIPFTYEPCYNTETPPFVMTFDMSHEMAHFKGFAREDEANFVAYLADTVNNTPYFRYAGHMMAFCYLSNALYNTDQTQWNKIAGGLDKRAKADIDFYNAYIQRFSGPVQSAANNVNDSYLKSQGETQGTVSYDLFVDLLAARYRTLHMQ